MILRSLLFVSFVALTSACGGDDDSGVSNSAQLSEVTTEEIKDVCAALELSLNLESQITVNCYAQAFDQDLADEAACNSAAMACIADPNEDALPDDLECDTASTADIPENCSATVGEMRACFDAVGAQTSTVATGLNCGNIATRAMDFKQVDEIPACMTFEDKCPGFFEDE